MFKYKHLLLFLVILMLILAACGGTSSSGGSSEESVLTSAVEGDAARGKSLYEGMVVGSNSVPGCLTCHSLEAGLTLVGPSHAGLATRAAEIIKSPNYTGQAKTVEAYLRESLIDPNAYTEEGFPPRVMYQNYGQDLSEQETSDIVAFMLTLE